VALSALNTNTDQRMTQLRSACKAGHMSCLKMLLDAPGAKDLADDDVRAEWAATTGHAIEPA
jgi:hypothetical protein